jgi:hypothetical protein
MSVGARGASDARGPGATTAAACAWRGAMMRHAHARTHARARLVVSAFTSGTRARRGLSATAYNKHTTSVEQSHSRALARGAQEAPHKQLRARASCTHCAGSIHTPSKLCTCTTCLPACVPQAHTEGARQDTRIVLATATAPPPRARLLCAARRKSTGTAGTHTHTKHLQLPRLPSRALLRRLLLRTSGGFAAAAARASNHSKAGFLRSAKRTTSPPQPSCFTRAG